MYGRKYMGIFRTTFIINEEGVIERIISPKEVKKKNTHNKFYKPTDLWQKKDNEEIPFSSSSKCRK